MATCEPSVLNHLLDLLGDNFTDQSKIWFPILHKDADSEFIHAAAGLCGESGEVMDALKKSFRTGVRTDEILDKMRSELTDTFIYMMMLGRLLNINWAEELIINRINCSERFDAQ